jgi:hypothetical protein
MQLTRVTTALLAAFMSMTPALAQEAISAKSGQSVDLGAVYWVENCQSRLDGFVGVEMSSGPAGVTLALRKEDVKAERQKCPTPVPGATVVATMPSVSQPVKGTIKYKVTYLLKNGGKQTSDHSRNISITP